MGEKRRSYDKEFKLSAVKLILEEGKSVAGVARDLGVNENSLHNWKRAYLEDQQNSFPGKGKMKPEDEELRKLRKELRDMTLERDILKKAIAYFTKHGE
ncbi:MAG: transposase [Ignavibacterium sp.]|jgi:transposase|nr:MAG: transposase [Ignavibacterium sp.]